MILLWLIFMILIWFWYGWFFVLWLCHRNLMFSATPTTTIPKAHLLSRVALWFFFSWLFVSACVAPPPPRVRRSTGNPQQRTNTEPGSPRSSRILNSWNMDGSDLKSQAQKNQIVYLCICHSRLTRIIPVRPCRLFLGSLGTSLWEAWEGEKLRGSWLGCLSF